MNTKGDGGVTEGWQGVTGSPTRTVVIGRWMRSKMPVEAYICLWCDQATRTAAGHDCPEKG